MQTKKRIEEMEEIVNEYDMIEEIENSTNWMLVDCKYTENGVEFNFKDQDRGDYVNITLKRTNKKGDE